MNKPTFAELFEMGVAGEKLTVPQAAIYLGEFTTSQGYELLRMGCAVRSVLLLHEMSEVSPYDNPQRIVEIQAERRVLGYLSGGFMEEAEGLYTDFMNRKDEKEKRQYEEQQEEYPPIPAI